MDAASELRSLAVALRKAASDMEEQQKTAAMHEVRELDPEKVRDFLMFFGGRNNGK